MSEEIGKIFVGGVDRSTQPDVFRQYFEEFGTLSDIILMSDKDNRGQNKGFGFVTFADPNCVKAVVARKNHKLDGKELDCKPCKARGTETRQGPGDQLRKKKIFVGGISQQASKEDLYDVFRSFGTVEDVHIMIDNETSKHRGFGFVTFESEEDVEKLVQRQHVELKGKSMEIKRAQPRNNQGRNFGQGGGQGGQGGFQRGGGGGGNWNQGGQPGYGGNGYGGGNNQWNMGQPMGQYGGQQGGGYQQQRGGQQQPGFNNGYRQPQQQQGSYSQQQPQASYGGKHSGGGDNYADQRSRDGAQSYGGYGGYQQGQQNPYDQQQQQQQQQAQPQQQYQSQGSMGNYAQEASGYGPQRGTYNQGYNQGPQTQQQQQPPQPSYGQVEGGQDMYGSNNYGKANMGNQFHPYSR